MFFFLLLVVYFRYIKWCWGIRRLGRTGFRDVFFGIKSFFRFRWLFLIYSFFSIFCLFFGYNFRYLKFDVDKKFKYKTVVKKKILNLEFNEVRGVGGL